MRRCWGEGSGAPHPAPMAVRTDLSDALLELIPEDGRRISNDEIRTALAWEGDGCGREGAGAAIAPGTTAASVLTGALRNQIDRIRDFFWSGSISKPLEVLEPLTYLPFIRRLEEQETSEERLPMPPSSRYAAPIPPEGVEQGIEERKGCCDWLSQLAPQIAGPPRKGVHRYPPVCGPPHDPVPERPLSEFQRLYGTEWQCVALGLLRSRSCRSRHGGDHTGDKVGRNWENKIPIEAAISLNEAGHPIHEKSHLWLGSVQRPSARGPACASLPAAQTSATDWPAFAPSQRQIAAMSPSSPAGSTPTICRSSAGSTRRSETSKQA
jgi:hypothetical protein